MTMKRYVFLVLVSLLAVQAVAMAQEREPLRVVEVPPASVAAVEKNWTEEYSFECGASCTAWTRAGGAHITDWPYTTDGTYHMHLCGGDYCNDAFWNARPIITQILADPMTLCFDWVGWTSELPYPIDYFRVALYDQDYELIQYINQRDNREADGQWRRWCCQIYGLNQFWAAYVVIEASTDFSNGTGWGVDYEVFVADQREPPGQERIYLPLSVRGNRRYQKCRVCQLLPSGDTTTVCVPVDNCSKGNYPSCPPLPGPYWSWTTVDRYCERY